MATTTNYSWSTPDNTAYVKDGASAIRTLGSSVDTTLFTALGGAYPGLRLIKKQTIGSAVSSVNVTGAFSSTYNSYKIIVSGGAGAANANVSLTFGGATSGYKWNLIYAQYTGTSNLTLTSGGVSGASFLYAGASSTNTINAEIDVNNPFLTKNTQVRATFISPTESGQLLGFLDNSTSYTDFTLTSGGTTMTGGTIYVYGYGAS
jgi:hypothetical protein